ncbi:MAG: DnaJ domain-containing protein [Moraxella sp.]|nr:DnaJ domain-containing protein [Moraxella sp.]
MRTHYEVLGVAKNATLAEIKAAYRLRVSHHHPDKQASTPHANTANNTADNTSSNAELIALNLAYETLKDPAKRAKYDGELAVMFWQKDGFVQGVRRLRTEFAEPFRANLSDNLQFAKQSVRMFFKDKHANENKGDTSQDFALGDGDVAVHVSVPIWQIALGEKVLVQAAGRIFRVQLPKNNDDKAFIIRGGGLPKTHGDGVACGDVYVQVSIAPLALDNLTDEQKQAFRALKAAFTDDDE